MQLFAIIGIKPLVSLQTPLLKLFNHLLVKRCISFPTIGESIHESLETGLDPVDSTIETKL